MFDVPIRRREFDFCGPDVDLVLPLSLSGKLLGEFVDLLGNIASDDGLFGGVDISVLIGSTLSSLPPSPPSEGIATNSSSPPSTRPLTPPPTAPIGGGSGGVLGGLGRLIGGGRRLSTLSSVTVGKGSCNGVRGIVIVIVTTLVWFC